MEYVSVMVKNVVGKNPDGTTQLEIPAYFPTVWGEIGRSKPYKKYVSGRVAA